MIFQLFVIQGNLILIKTFTFSVSNLAPENKLLSKANLVNHIHLKRIHLLMFGI